jgi:hypothetical protein
MSKLGELFKEAREGLKPWVNTPHESLAKVALRMDEKCVKEAIEFLDKLSEQKLKAEKETPWDGDASTSIAKQQGEIAKLLELSTKVTRASIAKGLESNFEYTRFWSARVLSKAGNKSVLKKLKQTLETETSELNIKMLNEAVSNCSRNRILSFFRRTNA